MGTKDRYGAKRKSGIRRVLPIIVIVCDDTRTAVAYFVALKHKVKDRKIINVYPAPFSGAAARDVLALAKKKTPEDVEPEDHIFILIDVDTNPDVGQLKSEAASGGVIALFSQPCFEVWTLAHLQDTGEYFLNCNSVLARIKTKWKDAFGTSFGTKAQADYEKLVDIRREAVIRCKRRNSSINQSWTEVWKAIEVIDE
jgi:hypothetical protein